MQLQPLDCDGARASVSAQLDGELPESEFDRVETHLLLCPACTAWAEEVRDVTRQLRGADLAIPVPGGFVLPRLRRRLAVTSAVALASAAAVVATMFLAAGRQNASLGSLVAPRLDTTYDVPAGVVYPPHPVLGSMTLGVSEPDVAAGRVRAI
ncbi:MAG: anti-sigma factor [Gaiellaceae bacterium]